MSERDHDFLKEFELFSWMDEKHLTEIYRLLERREYPPGVALFHEGNQGEGVFFLRKGKVKALKTSQSGEEQILEILQPGDVFGEVVLFGISEYPATTIAMGEIEVFFLSISRFREYFYENPDIGWGMLKEMARKLKKAQEMVENLGLRDTKGRVAALLLDLLYKFGNSRNELATKLNRQELASYAGTTRETVSRTLSEFKNKGLIEIDGSRILIRDLEGLKNLI